MLTIGVAPGDETTIELPDGRVISIFAKHHPSHGDWCSLTFIAPHDCLILRQKLREKRAIEGPRNPTTRR